MRKAMAFAAAFLVTLAVALVPLADSSPPRARSVGFGGGAG